VLQPALVSDWSRVESATPCMTGAVELTEHHLNYQTTAADKELKYRLLSKHLLHAKFKSNLTNLSKTVESTRNEMQLNSVITS
jgi:hypothetical protein